MKGKEMEDLTGETMEDMGLEDHFEEEEDEEETYSGDDPRQDQESYLKYGGLTD